MSHDLVVLMTANDSQEAHLVIGILEAAGIPAIVEGDSLLDEWAMTQRLMGQMGAEIKVPRSALEQARELIAESRAEGRQYVEDPADREEEAAEDAALLEKRSWPPSAWFTCFFLGALICVLGSMLVMTELDRQALLEDPLFRYEYNYAGTVMTQRSKQSGWIVAKYYDLNGNRIWEKLECLDREGRVTWISYDADEDGIYERSELFSSATDEPVLVSIDADGDQFPEAITVETVGGKKREFYDSNGDRRYDR